MRDIEGGYPLRIRPLITTSRARPVKVERRGGSSRTIHSRNGKVAAPYYGSTESVGFPPRSAFRPDHFLEHPAGSGKSVVWYISYQFFMFGEADGIDQLHDHRGRQTHARREISIDDILLF